MLPSLRPEQLHLVIPTGTKACGGRAPERALECRRRNGTPSTGQWLSDDKNLIRFTVRGTGIGLSLQQQEEVFFTQADHSTTRRFLKEGTTFWFAASLPRSLWKRNQVDGCGSEALAAIGQIQYDLVLMDICMPLMDGLEAAKRIRLAEDKSTGSEAGRIPIVALTANAIERDRDIVPRRGHGRFSR